MEQHTVPNDVILMCSPKYFEIKYTINAWMHMGNQVNTKLAKKQWYVLKELLEELGASIELIEPQQSLPDMVFSANAGLIYGNKFILSQFVHSERRGEESYWEEWFLAKGYEVVHLPRMFSFEGAGDSLIAANNLIFGGYGFRSSSNAYPLISKLLACQVVGLELVDPRFYHIDTCFCPLGECNAMYFPRAFSTESRSILNTYLKCYAVEEDEAENFACNAIVIQNNIVLPVGCPKTESMLHALGFKTHTVNMSEFIKAGGATKCLTLKLN